MNYPNGLAFSTELMQQIQDRFLYINEDKFIGKRLFFDNAGGSFRLKSVEQVFADLDAIPDCPERIHKMALYLQEVQKKGEDDIRLIFGADASGSIITSLTASQAMFQIVGTIVENVPGKNIVTTVLEHPSAFDAASYYAQKAGLELRVAPSNKITGGVEAEAISRLIDQDTVLLSVMYASNITGAIFDMEEIVRQARAIKPDLHIVVDAVQHAPHGVIDLQRTPVDAITFAPYKFFGYRGSGIGYVSDRVAHMPHHKLAGNKSNVWDLGSPAPAQYAAVSTIVDYVCWLGSNFTDDTDRRALFVEGMNRIKLQERALLHRMLEGGDDLPGLRHMKGITVYLDYENLTTRDFILAMGFDRIGYTQAVREYEKRNVIVYDRLASSIYSKRMLESFDMQGAVRVSPLHCNTMDDIDQFLRITQEIAAL